MYTEVNNANVGRPPETIIMSKSPKCISYGITSHLSYWFPCGLLVGIFVVFQFVLNWTQGGLDKVTQILDC